MNPTYSTALAIDWQLAFRSDREKALEQLYVDAFPMVRHYVRLNNGSEDDARDIFQDSLIIFYEKVMLDGLTLTAGAGTYLMGICKNRWRRELESRGRRVELENDEFELLLETDEEIRGKAWELTLMELVEKLGDRCRDLLLSVYYMGLTMDQIAVDLEYRNGHSVSVQKYKCLERLRKSVPASLLLK